MQLVAISSGVNRVPLIISYPLRLIDNTLIHELQHLLSIEQHSTFPFTYSVHESVVPLSSEILPGS